jgi:Domain of unknown function (DUF4262)
MCWQCDHPSDTPAEEDLDGLRASVREHGWAIKYVEDDRHPYAYTIGLHELGLPELVTTGVTLERALALLEYFIEEVLAKGAPRPGDRIVLSDNAMIEAVQVDHPEVHLGLAVALFGPELRAVQLVWTDMCGRWPWDAGFDFDGLIQPVLGARTRRARAEWRRRRSR